MTMTVHSCEDSDMGLLFKTNVKMMLFWVTWTGND